MFKRGAKKNPAPVPDAGESTRFNSTQMDDGSVRNEIIQVVWKDILKSRGIPLDLVACEIDAHQVNAGDGEVQIRLVVMRWSEKVLRYSFALQQELLVGIDDFEPGVDHSHYVFFWTYSKDCGCPHLSIPAQVMWDVRAKPAASAEASSVVDARGNIRLPMDS
jgi:hypothetical protein